MLVQTNITNAVYFLGVVLGIFFAISCRFTFARSSNCKSVLVSISRFEMGIFEFLVEMSLEYQLESCRQMSVS